MAELLREFGPVLMPEICLGGGQPLDEGHVILEGERVPVLDVKLDDEVLKHYVPSQISEGFASHVEVTQVSFPHPAFQFIALSSWLVSPK